MGIYNLSANGLGAEPTAYFWLKFFGGASFEISFCKEPICQKNGGCRAWVIHFKKNNHYGIVLNSDVHFLFLCILFTEQLDFDL